MILKKIEVDGLVLERERMGTNELLGRIYFTSGTVMLHFSQVQLPPPPSTTFLLQLGVEQAVYQGSASLCLMKFTKAFTVA